MTHTPLTVHLAYRTPYSRIAWRVVAGRMFIPLRIGYMLINLKVYIVLGTLFYLLASGHAIPMHGMSC